MVFIEEIEDENAPTVEELKAQIAQTLRERESTEKERLRFTSFIDDHFIKFGVNQYRIDFQLIHR